MSKLTFSTEVYSKDLMSVCWYDPTTNKGGEFLCRSEQEAQDFKELKNFEFNDIET